MRQAAIAMMLVLLITSVPSVGAAYAAPPRQETMNVLGGYQVLVCPTLVDLLWDWQQLKWYQGGGTECPRSEWFVMRGPSWKDEDWDKMQILHKGPFMDRDDFYRDRTVVRYEEYYYALWVIYQCPTDGEVNVHWIGTTGAYIAGECFGTLHQDLEFNGEQLKAPNILVRDGVKLSISGGEVRDGLLQSEGEGHPVGGLISIEGARLENTHVKFAAAGENCFEDNWVYGTPGKQLVVASDEAELKIANNHVFTGTLTIADNADVSVVGNELHNVVVGMNLEDSQPGIQDVRIAGNRFYDGSVHHAGGNVTVHDNLFVGTRQPRPLYAIQVEDSPWQKRPGVGWILGNDFSGYERAVSLVEGATAFVADNLIRDNVSGMWVRYDAQATVQANSFMGNVHGFYVYDAPDLAVGDNCIAGNSYGVWRGNYDPGLNVAARANWWGHPSGPQHESNPLGQGDIVSSGVDFADWLERDNCFVEVASQVIGTSGGMAGSGAASASVSLPAGAVGADTQVAVKRMDPSSMSTMPPTPAGLRATRLFNVSARRADDGTPVLELAKEATVTVNYSEQEAARVDETTLGLYLLGPGSRSRGTEGTAWWVLPPGEPTGAGTGETWILLPENLDPESNALTGRTTDLGIFAVLGEARASQVYVPLVVRNGR